MLFDFKEEKKPLEDYTNFYLTPHEWYTINRDHTKEEVIAHLNLLKKDLPFPTRVFSDEEIKKDFKDLKRSKINIRKDKWESHRLLSEMEYTYKGEYLYFDSYFEGLKIGRKFSDSVRMKCRHKERLSPVTCWEKSEGKFTFFRTFYSILKDEIGKGGITDKSLLRALKMHEYQASQFKPAMAKMFYNFFNAENVLDFSAGWGDRLIGFHASDSHSYIGIDPHTEMHDPYREITNFCNTGKRSDFICLPSEEVDYSKLKYDFVFTSPPYFNTELYSYEETQSWMRYKAIGDWLEGFLFKTLGEIYEHLPQGGRIAVNISDIISSKAEICKPLRVYMKGLGATYEGVVGYKMSKRNGVDYGDQIFCEPVFIWTKGEGKEPRWKEKTFF